MRRSALLAAVFVAALAGVTRAQDGFEIPDSQLHVMFSGFVLNHKTNTYDTTATFTNVSTSTFTGQFSLVLPEILPATATLSNRTCQTTDGKAVLVKSFPPAGLAPGRRVMGVVLKFSNPERLHLTFSHVVIAGNVCAEDLSFYAYSDSRALPQPDEVATLLGQAAPLYCLSQPAAPMTLAQAMTSLQTSLDGLAGANALEGFIAGNAQTNESQLVALATAAMSDNETPGALAALLAAHHNDPNNPAHLVSAAGAAELLGMPNEALALLDAADALGGDFGSPLGISGQAIAQNNRGYALLALGQFAQAQTQLASAAALEPLLSEARFNLAIAELCQGADATGPYLAALHRSPPQTLDMTFDLSPGVGPDMPNIPYPAVPEVLRRYANLHGDLYQGTLDKINTLLDQRDAVFAQLAANEAAHPAPIMETVRAADVFNAGDLLGIPAFDEHSPRGLSALWSVADGNKQAVVQLNNQLFAQFQTWALKRNDAVSRCTDPLPYCSADYQQVLLEGRTQVRQGLSVLLRVQGGFDRSVRAFADPWYRAITGLAANLTDPTRHQYRSLQARIDELFVYADLVANGGFTFGQLASWWEEAQGTDAPGDSLVPVVPDPLESLACPASLKSGKMIVDFPGVFEYSFNCEKLEVALTTPGLGPFAQLTVPRNGDWTVFAGAAGSLPIPGVKLGAKIGFFIKGNDQGYTDGGFKTTQSFGAGPLRVDSPFNFEAGIVAAKQCFLGCD
jgi:tetratricopeptide (TPR) repeat protein